MNEEMALVWQIPLRILPVVLFSFFYALGGRHGKYWRRWVGSSVLCAYVLILAMVLGTFNYFMPIPFVILYIGLSLGYGADEFWKKVQKRAVFGAVLGLFGLFFSITAGYWELGVFQLILAVFASTFLGVVNPTKATFEEALIGALSVFCVPFMV